MAVLVGIIINIISPIFIVIGISVFVARRFDPPARTLSTPLIYIFIPALVFNGMAASDLTSSEMAGIAGVVLGLKLVMVGGGLLLSRLLHFDRRLESAFIVSVMLMNAANYGIPLNTFAFGEAGGQRAVIYYVMSSLFGAALGIYFASRGASSMRQALLNVFRVPITYAALLGLLFNIGGFSLPLPLQRAVEIMAQAAVPAMLVLLGFQLARVSLRGRWGPLLLASGMRLLLAPLVALPLALLFNLSGVTFQVAIVESAMPTAVITIALTTEFNSDVEFASAATLVSTLLSIATLSVLLALLM